MPFEQYLETQYDPSQSYYEFDAYPPASPRPMYLSPPMHMAVQTPPETITYNNPQLQLSNFIYDHPTLAPGGSAEVFPPGLTASPWVSSCGFMPSFIETTPMTHDSLYDLQYPAPLPVYSFDDANQNTNPVAQSST